ncbi:MAG: hypothetical protein K6A64_03980 [Bacteroidales bacterium]|nr:hypothetical protein [Bacteroidales bacterium]
MRRLVNILVSVVLVMAGIGNARAQEQTSPHRKKGQWSATLDVSGGFGWMRGIRHDVFEDMYPKYLYHVLGKGDVSLSYKSPEFLWSASLNGHYEQTQANRYHFDLNMADPEKVAMKTVVKMSGTRPSGGVFRTDFSWLPKLGARYDLWLKYDLKIDGSSDNVMNAEAMSLDYTVEKSSRQRHGVSMGFGFREEAQTVFGWRTAVQIRVYA